ncbi:Erythroid differentiation-related factor 1-like protein [Drosera capensis]
MDVIAPADILKQIFKMPYSKAKLSIAVHRIGNTLVLNPGPGIEEGERLVRRNHTKCADHSLFLNFAFHSVRMEACDCPPSHSASKSQAKSSMLPDSPKFHERSFTSSDIQMKTNAANDEVCGQNMDNSDVKKTEFLLRRYEEQKGKSPVKKVSQVDRKPKCSVRESDNYRRGGSDEFLRVLIWQFHNFRMLLCSDLLLISNEKYLAVSLHLCDISYQVTPLNWLEAWLDNVMASVPELATCYHLNGVVQGYELLKTDDIFLMKGISEDGTPVFHPYVVEQNGPSVLRFLQEYCKQDPGAYWLYKCAGEDVIQLFDISVIPASHQSDNYDNCASSLPSFIYRGRADALSSLGKLLYRVAHRLALSMAPGRRARCSDFFRKCFELLEEPDHMVIRALAHEQFVRLILNNDSELDLTVQASSLMFEAKAASTADESLDSLSSIPNLDVHGPPSPANGSLGQDGQENHGIFS